VIIGKALTVFNKQIQLLGHCKHYRSVITKYQEMKHLLALVLFFAFAACENTVINAEIPDNVAFLDAEAVAEFKCINQQADNPPSISDARKWIVGKWQLKGMITMITNAEVPNIKIEFKEDGGVFITNAGENVFTNAYSLNSNETNGYKSIVISTDEFGTGPFNENNIIRGTIRICENELMIDNGIAFDAPGYLLRRIQ
jgi:hypothetical protein